jgi:hypothetical protein
VSYSKGEVRLIQTFAVEQVLIPIVLRIVQIVGNIRCRSSRSVRFIAVVHERQALERNLEERACPANDSI